MKADQLPQAGADAEKLRVELAKAISRCEVAKSLGAGNQQNLLLQAMLTAAIAALAAVD